LNKNDLSAAFLETISEVVTWCSYCEKSGYPIRSPELDPIAILGIPDFSHSSESIEVWIERKRDCYRRAIPWINQTRSELLKATGIATPGALNALSQSRLLLYTPLETVADGAAESSSTGFYDIEDAPPWDTWFLYESNAIFCCVPEFSISAAQAGIDANPVDCIHWANWSELVRFGK